MNKIDYIEGHVAFIDILGFSNLVLDKDNADKVKDVTEFVGKFQYFFNSSPKLRTKVAFFSDSIVLTTDDTSDLGMLFLAIWIAESYLYSKTGLLFRGGISRGLFYHNEAIAFGPAIINSYRLENQANYSRIIIQDEIVNGLPEIPASIFKDIDGKYCFNPCAIGMLRNTPDSTEPTKEQFLKSFEEEREFVLKVIMDNLHTPVSDKYLWRMRAFNMMCELIPDTFKAYNIELNDDELSELNKKKISLDNFWDLRVYE